MHLGNPAIAPNLFGRCSSLTASHPTAVKWPVLVHVLISGSVSMVLGVRCVLERSSLLDCLCFPAFSVNS